MYAEDLIPDSLKCDCYTTIVAIATCSFLHKSATIYSYVTQDAAKTARSSLAAELYFNRQYQ